MKLIKSTLPAICLAMLGCSATVPPEFGMVDWYLNNGTGSKLTLAVYDKVCKRTYFKVPIARGREVVMTTCADSEGRADIRYKYAGGNYGQDNTWRDDHVNKNQSLVVR